MGTRLQSFACAAVSPHVLTTRSYTFIWELIRETFKREKSWADVLTSISEQEIVNTLLDSFQAVGFIFRLIAVTC